MAAVETTPERKPRRLRLTVVKGFRKKEIATLAKRDLAAGSNVVTDGLSCWTAVGEAGCDHFPMVTGSGPNAAKWVPFTWVNTALGNIKTALAGTYHHVSAKHAQRYLTSFAWRFNRRYQLDTLTERLAYACARTAPQSFMNASGIVSRGLEMPEYQSNIVVMRSQSDPDLRDTQVSYPCTAVRAGMRRSHAPSKRGIQILVQRTKSIV